MHSGLFLAAFLGLDVMSCAGDTHEALCSRISLCAVGRAFVRAASQLSFLVGSHIGNHKTCLQVGFWKTTLPSSPLLVPTPFPQQSGHSRGVAPFLASPSYV